MFDNLNTQKIDATVAAGEVIAVLKKEDLASNIPGQIGDWTIRVVTSSNTELRTVVAVPSNGRTRTLYNAGRILWLRNMGFSEERANRYFHASAQVAHRWEDDVARFVLDNWDMSDDTYDAIRAATSPRQRAEELGVTVTLTRPRLNAAMQILANVTEPTHH
jgi:hypothetical protein